MFERLKDRGDALGQVVFSLTLSPRFGQTRGTEKLTEFDKSLMTDESNKERHKCFRLTSSSGLFDGHLFQLVSAMIVDVWVFLFFKFSYHTSSLWLLLATFIV